MRRQADNHGQAELVFDLPESLLELLYGRAALGLDVLPELPAPMAAVHEHGAGAEGAGERWLSLWQQAVAHFDSQQQVSQPHWLFTSDWQLTSDAVDLDLAAARTWIHEQRQLVIDTALTANTTNGPLLSRRGATLAGTAITCIAILPVTGHCSLRPTANTLIVDLATFLDDRAWQHALSNGSAG